jgi:SEC-C motif
MSAQDYRRLQNDELIDLLFTQEDRLPLPAIEEVIRRGQEIMPMLAEIVMDRMLWTAELPDSWAPVHATYALGAIGGEASIVPLFAALRWSDAYDNEWVTEDLPAILGSLGGLSHPSLLSASRDRSAGWSARSIAMDALGSQALQFPEREEEVMRLLGQILQDPTEEHGARRSAAFVLLDFRRSDYRRDLIAIAEAEVRWQEQHPEYHPAFRPEEVRQELAAPRVGMEIYTRDWLEFYDPSEILRRQQRWTDEERRTRPDAIAMHPSTARDAILIGRNDPCPCGSGKPYKRCCLNKLH